MLVESRCAGFNRSIEMVSVRSLMRLVPGDSLSASAGDEERLSLECHGHCVGRIVGVSVGLPCSWAKVSLSYSIPLFP